MLGLYKLTRKLYLKQKYRVLHKNSVEGKEKSSSELLVECFFYSHMGLSTIDFFDIAYGTK